MINNILWSEHGSAKEITIDRKHTARYTSDFFNQALAASTGPRHFGLY
jgi:hypothetical protein